MAQQIRDIRADLRTRLNLIGPRRSSAQTRYETELREIEQEELMLKTLLAAEERLMAAAHITVERPWAASAFESAILEVLSDEGPWDHGAIKTTLIQRGYGKEDDSKFGQSLQGTLLSMSHRDLVMSAGRGIWQITKLGLTGEA